MASFSELFYVRKGALFILVVVFCLNFVLAGGSWDSFDESNGSSVVLGENLSNNSIGLDSYGTKISDNFNLGGSSFEGGDSFEYTSYFYIALGVGIVGILIVGLFIYLFLRRPKNKWNKKRVLK